MKRIGLHPVLIGAISIGIGLCSALMIAAYTSKNYFLSFDGTTLRGTDLSYNLIYTKALWLDGAGNIYDTRVQDRILAAFLGAPLPSAGVVTWSPVGFLILLPFSLLSDLRLSNIGWALVCISLLSYSVISYMQRVVLSYHLLVVAMLVVAIFSHTFFYSFAIGQSSILATSALILLTGLSLTTHDENRKADVIGSLLLLLLAIKPPYLIVGILLAFGFQRWRVILGGLTIVFTVLLLVTVKLGGFSWIVSYMEMLRLHSSIHYPERYSVGFDHQLRVSNLVNAISPFVSRDVGATISLLLMLVGWVGALAVGYRNLASNLEPSVLPGVIGGLSYLLFSPYIGGYEDVLIVFPIFALLTVDTPKLASLGIVALLASSVIMNVGSLTIMPPLSLLWGLKLALCSWLLLVLGKRIKRESLHSY